jgi:hypothetical protein
MATGLRAAAFSALGLLAGAGCGPIQSTAYLLDASSTLEAARSAQAEKLAPYEWTAANLYLAKSREEVGYSEYEQAVDYARKAVDFATRARDGALKAVRKPATVPVAPPAAPPPAPAPAGPPGAR